MGSVLDQARREQDRLAPVIDANPGVCVYCGMPATSKDHLVNRLQIDNSRRCLVPTVPACRRCNSVINTFGAISVPQRARYIAKRERRKFAGLLQRKEWSDSELAQLGGRMQEFVMARQARQDLLLARLRNLEAGGIGSSSFCVIIDEDFEP